MPSATVCFSVLIAAPAHTPNTSGPRPPNPDTFLLLPLRRRAADAHDKSKWRPRRGLRHAGHRKRIGRKRRSAAADEEEISHRSLGGREEVARRTLRRRGWDIKRFAWAPLGLEGTRRILWLPRVVIHAGFGVVGCSRVLQRIFGCLRRAMRRRTAASSATEGRCSPSNSLAGLPWDEFIRRVAAAEADAERAAINRAHRRTNSSGRADESTDGRQR